MSVDPDSELIVATTVTAGNAGDASAAGELLTDDLADPQQDEQPSATVEEQTDATAVEPATDPGRDPGQEPLSVYGDSAYGAGELVNTLEHADAEVNCKVQPPVAPGGRFSKDAFTIDLEAGTVGCPAGHTAVLRTAGEGRIAYFGQACAGCPLAEKCTTARGGRTVFVGPYEQQLAHARARQRDPTWKADYTATRPKVERKIAHLMRRRHGGRRARVRGAPKATADFAVLAAAVNLARLAVLGLTAGHGGWQATTA